MDGNQLKSAIKTGRTWSGQLEGKEGLEWSAIWVRPQIRTFDQTLSSPSISFQFRVYFQHLSRSSESV